MVWEEGGGEFLRFAPLSGQNEGERHRKINWRASETLTGVTQLKIGDVCLFIYMFGRTYVILYFDLLVFLC